jgi:hypothetical protein
MVVYSCECCGFVIIPLQVWQTEKSLCMGVQSCHAACNELVYSLIYCSLIRNEIHTKILG